MVWDELDLEAKQSLETFYKSRNISFEIRAILVPWIETGIITTDLIPGSCEDHDQRIRWLHMQFIQELDRVIEDLEDSGEFDDSIEFRRERCELFDTLPQVWYQNLKDCLIQEEIKYIEFQRKPDQQRIEAQRVREQEADLVRNDKQTDTVGNVNQTEIGACQQNRCKEPKNRNSRRFFTKFRHFWSRFL